MAPHLGSGYIHGVVGLLSISLQGVKLFRKTVLAYNSWVQEPDTNSVGLGDDGFKVSPGGDKKLKIGILWSDEIVKPHPPIQRALQEVAKKMMEVKNVEVVEWTPYKNDLAWEIIVS